MPFNDDIISHESIITRIKASMSDGRIPHAQLYTGQEGIGKRLTAISFAKALNCNQHKTDYCNICNSCTTINNGVHPDVYYIKPEESNFIKIDQFRQWQKSINYKPYMGKWKISIIDMAEKMTDSAANSILKILEEPPKDTVIILITTEACNLLPTIVSRCQIFKFHPIPKERTIQFLKNKKNCSEAQAQLIWCLSKGSLSIAMELNIDKIFELREKWVLWFTQIEQQNFDEIENLNSSKFSKILGIVLQWLRDIWILQKGIGDMWLSNIDMLDDLKKTAIEVPPSLIEYRINLILDAINCLDKNVNLKILIKSLMLQWNKPRKKYGESLLCPI